MNYMPFVWASILKRGLLLEVGGPDDMTVIDPVDIAAVAAKALREDGHEGQTYDLTSEDSLTITELARRLSHALQRNITIFKGDVKALRAALIENGAPGDYAPLMADYFAKVATGFLQDERHGCETAGPRAAYLCELARRKSSRRPRCSMRLCVGRK